MQNSDFSSLSVGQSATSVSVFVRQIRQHLERQHPLQWISGEVSGLTRASSGHLYFSLKDADGQLRCAMWRTKAQLLAFRLQEGMQIEVRAQATVYEARGDLQLSVEQIRLAGQGNLFEAFLRLKATLAAEGLFDSAHKQTLPRLPRHIGLITSRDAAALRDVLSTLARRAPHIRLTLYPARVQGEGAAQELANAIAQASKQAASNRPEALILCRGGGSLEDLWAFNEEVLIRAIHTCPLPIISGVGHETDTTLSDYAADLRAATPTAAAELISAHWVALPALLDQLNWQLQRHTERLLASQHQRLDLLEKSLIHPRQQIASATTQLQQYQLRLRHSVQKHFTNAQQRLHAVHLTKPSLEPLHHQIQRLQQDLQQSLRSQQQTRQQKLTQLNQALTLLSPQEVLARGYAIARKHTGEVLTNSAAVAAEDSFELVLHQGSVKVRATR